MIELLEIYIMVHCFGKTFSSLHHLMDLLKTLHQEDYISFCYIKSMILDKVSSLEHNSNKSDIEVD